MSAGTFAALPGDRFGAEGWDDLAADAREPGLGSGPPPGRVAAVDRGFGDRVVLAVLGLAAFALLGIGL